MEPVTESHERRLTRFEQATLPHLDRIYSAALLMTGSPDEADDLLQNTFAQAFASFHQVRRGADVQGWLYRVLSNTRAEAVGKRQPQLEPVAVDVREPGEPAEAESQARSGPVLSDGEALSRLPDSEIKDALRRLPEDVRVAVYLADAEGYTYPEIADIVGAPVSVVATWLREGRRQLRELLLGYSAAAGLAPG